MLNVNKKQFEKKKGNMNRIITKTYFCIYFIYTIYMYVFCSLNDKQTVKIVMQSMLIDHINLCKKESTSIWNKSREIHVSIFIHSCFCNLADRQMDKYSYYAYWSENLYKNNHTSILNSSQDVDVSIFIHLCLFSLAVRPTDKIFIE